MEKQNYLATFETWFTDRLSVYDGDKDVATFLRDVKSKVLESYRNGQRSRRWEKKPASTETK